MPRQTFQRRGSPQSFSRGFFGGKARGVSFRFGILIGELFAISDFSFRKDAVAESFAEFVQRFSDSFYICDVYSDTGYHKSDDQLFFPPAGRGSAFSL